VVADSGSGNSQAPVTVKQQQSQLGKELAGPLQHAL
jgi:hypothetical protein